MTQLLLTPAAQADMDHIWDYTVEHWSLDQADRYTDDIRDARQDLAAGRKRGRTATVRRLPEILGRHTRPFLSRGSHHFIVVRIPHGRMDADRHLN